MSNCANAASTPSINLPVDVSSIGSVKDVQYEVTKLEETKKLMHAASLPLRHVLLLVRFTLTD